MIRKINVEFEKSILYYVIRYVKDDNKEYALKNLLRIYNEVLIAGDGCFSSKHVKPRSFVEFIEILLSKPIGEIFSSTEITALNKNTSDFIKENSDIAILDEFGMLSESFEQLYYNFKTIYEEEQSNVAEMVLLLRERNVTNGHLQQVYDLMRNALCFKMDLNDYMKPLIDRKYRIPLNSDNIWTEEELMEFKQKIFRLYTEKSLLESSSFGTDFLNFFKSFENCFDQLENTGSISLCRCCGLPVEKKGQAARCISQETCKYHKHYGGSYPITKVLEKNKKYFAVKKGVQWYITRTGMEEYFCGLDILDIVEENFKDFEVYLYPKMDAKGDILIKTPKGNMYIDLKDWKYAGDLIDEIIKHPGKFRNKDMLYIPEYRFQLYQASRGASKIQKALEQHCTVNGKYPRVVSSVSSKAYNVKNVIRQIYKNMGVNE